MKWRTAMTLALFGVLLLAGAMAYYAHDTTPLAAVYSQDDAADVILRNVEGGEVDRNYLPFFISPIWKPRFVSLHSAAYRQYRDFTYFPAEVVLGVTAGKVAKAYSAWYLARHELVEDEVGGVPIMVAW